MAGAGEEDEQAFFFFFFYFFFIIFFVVIDFCGVWTHLVCTPRRIERAERHGQRDGCICFTCASVRTCTAVCIVVCCDDGVTHSAASSHVDFLLCFFSVSFWSFLRLTLVAIERVHAASSPFVLRAGSLDPCGLVVPPTLGHSLDDISAHS
jgi:hypothetical protein